MAESKSGESRHAFQVAYVGDVDDHTMDAEELGPALTSLSKLIRAANATLNGERANVKLLVASDFEHKCFNINFEVIQIIKQLRDLLGALDIKDTTELLKHLGVIATAGSASLLAYLKWRKGRQVTSAIEVKDSPGTLIIKVEGDHNTFQITKEAYLLSEKKEVLEAVEGTLAPIEQGNKMKSIEFRQNDKPLLVLAHDEVAAIVQSCEAVPVPIAAEVAIEEPKIVTATLYVYGPVFDEKAPNWRFLYKKKHIYADLRDTNIARDAVKRGGAFLNDRYRVKMEVTPSEKDDGTPHYRITQVLEFTPAEQQSSLPLRKARKKRAATRAR